jgi:hypothetical protein
MLNDALRYITIKNIPIVSCREIVALSDKNAFDYVNADGCYL